VEAAEERRHDGVPRGRRWQERRHLGVELPAWLTDVAKASSAQASVGGTATTAPGGKA
jgi:hypothetical protein